MSLPPGFRFHPTDVELIMFYLKRKVSGKKFTVKVVSEINIYKFSPWDLPDKSCLKSKDLEWYFFCPRERKYASGGRMNRATETGYWKTTGKDRAILYDGRNVGMVKTLVFHQGPAPRGERTDWVIHEYRLEDQNLADAGIVQDSYVLCKVFKKNGLGPKNGAQYGAPFKEEEWDDDTQVSFETLFGVQSADGASTSALTLPEIPSSSVLTSKCCPETASAQPSLPISVPSSAEAPTDVVLPDVPDDDDILRMLASFTENTDIPPLAGHIANTEMLEDNIHERNITPLPCSDADADCFHNLGELDGTGTWPEVGDSGGISIADYELNSMCFPDAFLELNDLARPLNPSDVANQYEHLQTSNLNETNNSYINNNLDGGLYQGTHSFAMNQYYAGPSHLMLPPPPERSTMGYSDMLQVGVNNTELANGDGSYINPVYNAASSFSFGVPDESRGIDHGVNEGTNVNQIYTSYTPAYDMSLTEPVVYRGIDQRYERSGFQNFR